MKRNVNIMHKTPNSPWQQYFPEKMKFSQFYQWAGLPLNTAHFA
jgi:hypothetical protein